MTDYDDRIDSRLLSETTVQAAKTHTCSVCARIIAPGETYRRRFGLIDGAPVTQKFCAEHFDA